MEIAVRRGLAELYAKSLRRSGEITLASESTPRWPRSRKDRHDGDDRRHGSRTLRQARHSLSRRPCRSTRSTGSLRSPVGIGEDPLRQFLQARGRLGARRGLRDGGGVEVGRRQPGHEARGRRPQRVGCPCDRLADELRLPAGQLDEAVERNAAFRRVPEREGDQVHRAADRLDRDVLTRLRPARLLHRREDLTMALDRRGELTFGLGPGIRRARRRVDARRHRSAPVGGSVPQRRPRR